MSFKFEGYDTSSETEDFKFEGYEEKSQEPATLKGSAGQYGAGVAGGAGGLPVDILELVKPTKAFSPLVHAATQLQDVAGLKPTGQLTEDVSQQLGLQEPQNALERILRQSGEFGGQEALMGLAGGPVPSALGLAHGSASGALYGGLKELGMDDPWALGITALFTLSPIAAQKFWPKLKEEFKAGRSFNDAITDISGGGAPPPPPGAGGGGKGGTPPGPPGGGAIIKPETPPEPLFKGLRPEHEILETAEPLLKGELESRLPQKPIVPSEIKFSDIGEPLKPSKPTFNVHEAEREVGSHFSNVKIPNTTVASRGIRNEINTLSNRAYAENSALWEESRELNRGVETIRPGMVEELRELVEEINLAEVPSSVQRDIRRIAQRYINIGEAEGGLIPISNDKIIAQRISNNQKINHDYMQGRPNNAYSRLNEILDNGLEEAADLSPAAREANLAARRGYAEWQQRYGNNDILPWRDPAQTSHSKLFKNIENPDQLNSINNVLGQSERGRVLYNATRRDFVEKQMRSYIENPKNIGDLAYEEKMRELSAISTPEERTALEKTMDNIADPYRKYESALESYNAHKTAHKNLENQQKSLINEWKKEVNGSIGDWKQKAAETKKSFPYSNSNQILRDMTSVHGMKRLESWLPNTKEGKEFLNQAKEYAGVNLLSQGKIIPSDSAQSLKKILNDINSRALLEHALGKEVVTDIHKIVNNVKKIDDNMSRIKGGFKIAKTGAKLIPGVRGHVASAEALYDIWQSFKPAIERASYETIDMQLIEDLIKNRKELLSNV